MARLRRPVPAAARSLHVSLIILLLLSAACSAAPASTGSASEISRQPAPTGEAAAVSTRVADRPTAPSPSEASPTVMGTPVAATSTAPPPVRQGTSAQGARVRFIPRSIELPGGGSATVEAEPTVDGVLQIPADIRHVGWWDGSSYAGDPFGSTVIAGHVDSRLQGLGFFAELILVQVGDVITVRSETEALTYRVMSTTLVKKDALASESRALEQDGPHRLVLITCSGQWYPDLRSYDSNLIVMADPVID